MITFFAIPKPFIGEAAIHQRNAISSWIHSCNNPEIILFGDEEGISDIAEEFNLIHIKTVKVNEYGTPFLDQIFYDVQKIASADLICYLNCDIILINDPELFIEKIPYSNFLISGRRINFDLPNCIDFSNPDIKSELISMVEDEGTLDTPYSMDYFIFPKNQINFIPQFLVGRLTWDVWMIWAHKKLFNHPIIDATPIFTIIHQNHGYGHIKSGEGFFSEGFESNENRKKFSNNSDLFYNILDADFILDSKEGLIPVRVDQILRIHRLKRRLLSRINEKTLFRIQKTLHGIRVRLK